MKKTVITVLVVVAVLFAIVIGWRVVEYARCTSGCDGMKCAFGGGLGSAYCEMEKKDCKRSCEHMLTRAPF